MIVHLLRPIFFIKSAEKKKRVTNTFFFLRYVFFCQNFCGFLNQIIFLRKNAYDGYKHFWLGTRLWKHFFLDIFWKILIFEYISKKTHRGDLIKFSKKSEKIFLVKSSAVFVPYVFVWLILMQQNTFPPYLELFFKILFLEKSTRGPPVWLVSLYTGTNSIFI